jgi:hypothetical protein
MGATAAAMGLVPVYHPSGLDRANMYTINPTYNTAIFKGDPVILNSNGTVTVGAAASALMGVFAGCEYVDSTGKPTLSNFYPASQSVQSGSEIRCYVYDDPNIVYEIQAVGQLSATLATAMAFIGDEADITYVAGSTSTGLSACNLNTAAMAGAGSQKQFRIIGVGLAPDNAITDLYPILRVTLANTQLRAATTAV